jgi:hypothetical protein
MQCNALSADAGIEQSTRRVMAIDDDFDDGFDTYQAADDDDGDANREENGASGDECDGEDEGARETS